MMRASVVTPPPAPTLVDSSEISHWPSLCSWNASPEISMSVCRPLAPTTPPAPRMPASTFFLTSATRSAGDSPCELMICPSPS